MASTSYFTAHQDTNTAMLNFLNAYYGTASQDLNALLQRFLRDNSATTPPGTAGTANDSTRARALLKRAIEGGLT